MDVRDCGAAANALSRHLYKLMINRKQSQASDRRNGESGNGERRRPAAMPNDVVKR